MSYLETGINDSPTIATKAAATIPDGAFLTAKLTVDGVSVAGANDVPVGIFIAEDVTLRSPLYNRDRFRKKN